MASWNDRQTWRERQRLADVFDAPRPEDTMSVGFDARGLVDEVFFGRLNEEAEPKARGASGSPQLVHDLDGTGDKPSSASSLNRPLLQLVEDES